MEALRNPPCLSRHLVGSAKPSPTLLRTGHAQKLSSGFFVRCSLIGCRSAFASAITVRMRGTGFPGFLRQLPLLFVRCHIALEGKVTHGRRTLYPQLKVHGKSLRVSSLFELETRNLKRIIFHPT